MQLPEKLVKEREHQWKWNESYYFILDYDYFEIGFYELCIYTLSQVMFSI